jgi:hypothetical protein
MGQEPPGLNTVFDADVTTVKLLSDHFARLNAADENAPSARQNVAAPSAATAH